MDEKPLHPSFCPLPFVQVATNPDGKVRPCCWNDYELGDIQKQTIEEIWNSPAAQKLRNEFITGDINICKDHIRDRACHKWGKSFLHKAVPEAFQNQPMQRMHLQLNGHCNLECIMCTVWKMPNGLFGETNFWNISKEKFFPFLEEAYISGGEPFVQKDTYRAIEEISKLNPNCRFSFVTNAHYRFSEKIKQSLDKIRIQLIQISIDSLSEENYAAIRVNGNLNQVTQTVHDWIQYRQSRMERGMEPFDIHFEVTLLKNNVHELKDFVAYGQKHQQVNFGLAYFPRELSLLDLPETEKMQVIADVLDAFRDYPNETLIHILIPLFNSLTQDGQFQSLELCRKKLFKEQPLQPGALPIILKYQVSNHHEFLFHLHAPAPFPKLKSAFFHGLAKLLGFNHEDGYTLYKTEIQFWKLAGSAVLPFCSKIEYRPVSEATKFNFYPTNEHEVFTWIKESQNQNDLLALALLEHQGDFLTLNGIRHLITLKNILFPNDSFQTVAASVKSGQLEQTGEPYSTLLQHKFHYSNRDIGSLFANSPKTYAEIFNCFGPPGLRSNSGVLALIANLCIEFLKYPAVSVEILPKLQEFIDTQCPHFPHPLLYYAQPDNGRFFEPDMEQWIAQFPEDIRALENRYRKLFEEWKDK